MILYDSQAAQVITINQNLTKSMKRQVSANYDSSTMCVAQDLLVSY